MKPIQLNKSIPIPLYFQLKQYLIQQIENGEWKPGDLLPSEREMSELYGISRMTVRQALIELVNEGRLVREQGKGTFVAEPKISQGLLRLTSFSEDMRARGMTPGAIVLDRATIPADLKLAQELNVPEGDPIIRIKRVRLADERPMAIEQSHIPLSRFPSAAEQDFNQISLYKWLEMSYGVHISHARQTIEVGIPQPEEAEILHIPRTMPILLTERTTFDILNQPVELAKSIYRGDRYKLTVDLQR